MTAGNNLPGIYFKGTAARKAMGLYINGGTFNCSIFGVSKSKLLISGGTFNYIVASQGDSTAYRLISGGTFKAFGYMTADINNTKFWIGTAMGKSDVVVYVDDNGYLVIGGPVVTEPGTKFKASTARYGVWSSYLKYSSANENGLYYTSVSEAFADNDEATDVVTIYTDTVDLTELNYQGTINLPENINNLVITFTDGTEPLWTVTTSAEGKEITYTDVTSNGIVTRTYNVV